ncbi:MAG: hypothetical protein RIB46_21010 [Pseudomonadales bacterium]
MILPLLPGACIRFRPMRFLRTLDPISYLALLAFGAYLLLPILA